MTHCDTGLHIATIGTPLGAMVATATDECLVQLEFGDSAGGAFSATPGENAVLDRLRSELCEYFAGTRREFTVPLAMDGTDFQKRVWRELQRIPFGSTASYEDIATRLGSSAKTRAVGQANGSNRIYLLIPCHRVIAKNGTLGGYGGGAWRKQRVLELERTGKLPT